MILYNEKLLSIAILKDDDNNYEIKRQYKPPYTVPKDFFNLCQGWTEYAPFEYNKWYIINGYMFMTDNNHIEETDNPSCCNINTLKCITKNGVYYSHKKLYYIDKKDIYFISKASDNCIRTFFREAIKEKYHDGSIVKIEDKNHIIENISNYEITCIDNHIQITVDDNIILYDNGVWLPIHKELIFERDTLIRLKPNLDRYDEDLGFSGIVMSHPVKDLYVNDTYRVEGLLHENREFLIISRTGNSTRSPKTCYIVHHTYFDIVND